MRPAITLVVAVAVGAYLALGDLRTSFDDSGSDAHLLISAAGVVALVALAGWHAVWLLPATSIGVATVYEEWFWEPPRGMASVGGMDSIGMHPTDVVWSLVLVLPVAALLAVLRAALLHRRRTIAAEGP